MAIRKAPWLNEPAPGYVVFTWYEGSRLISHEVVRDEGEPFEQLMLEYAERRKSCVPYCGCKTGEPESFYLQNKEGILWLCCRPRTKNRHAMDCPRYEPEVKAGDVDVVHHDAVLPSADDLLSDLGRPARIPTRTKSSVGDKKKKQKKRLRRKRGHRSRLAGQLLRLIHVSGTNAFDPEATPAVASDLLERYAAAIPQPEIIFDGARAIPKIFVLGAGAEPTQEELRISIGDSEGSITPIVLVAEVTGVTDSDQNHVSLRMRGTCHVVSVKRTTWNEARVRGASIATRWATRELGGDSPKARVICLLHVSINEPGMLVAHRVGLAATSLRGIPIDSEYELKMENHLVTQRRRFMKPIFRDNGYPHLHDFVLLDMDRPFAIEVNGRDDEGYQERKRKTREFLDENLQGHYLIWSAIDGDPFPDLPAAAD